MSYRPLLKEQLAALAHIAFFEGTAGHVGTEDVKFEILVRESHKNPQWLRYVPISNEKWMYQAMVIQHPMK